jgi:hypothetical protein
VGWHNLGVLTPTLQWQLYNIPVIGTESFMVRSSWTIPPFYKMRAYLGQFFATTTEVVGTKRIYPIKDADQGIELLIPDDFKNNGQITRYIGIQLVHPYRVGMRSYDWQVSLDEFMPDPTAGSSTNSQTSSNASTINSVFPGATPGFY